MANSLCGVLHFEHPALKDPPWPFGLVLHRTQSLRIETQLQISDRCRCAAACIRGTCPVGWCKLGPNHSNSKPVCCCDHGKWEGTALRFNNVGKSPTDGPTCKSEGTLIMLVLRGQQQLSLVQSTFYKLYFISLITTWKTRFKSLAVTKDPSPPATRLHRLYVINHTQFVVNVRLCPMCFANEYWVTDIVYT